jgi:hypothetical protein
MALLEPPQGGQAKPQQRLVTGGCDHKVNVWRHVMIAVFV